MILALFYYVVFYILFIAIGIFVPDIATSFSYLIIGFILPPIITGLVITRLHQLDISSSERWMFSVITSLLVSSASMIVFALVLGTDEGRELYLNDINEAGFSTTSILATSMIAFSIIYLLSNRIGYGIGSILGKISD